MVCCCGGSDHYQPDTASDYQLVTVTVPQGYKPGQTIQVSAPARVPPSTTQSARTDAYGGQATGNNTATRTATANVVIPDECCYEGSTFMVRFPDTNTSKNTNVNAKGTNSNTATSTTNRTATATAAATVISPKEEMKICVQVSMGARVGSIMYAGVPGDSNRVLPIRVPSKKIKKFYVSYTLQQTILRSDIDTGGDGVSGKKQNWHDNRLAVMAPLFF